MAIQPPTVHPSVRIDKWLWAARFFKTRALAAKACDLGRIHSNAIQAKPARDVRIGDMLQIKNEGGEFEIEVLVLSEMRGPAAQAKTLYRETEASTRAAWSSSPLRKPCSCCRATSRQHGPPNATGVRSTAFAADKTSPRTIVR